LFISTRGVAEDSYREKIPITPVPADEAVSSEEFEVSEEELTQREGWDDLEHLPLSGLVVESIGLAAEERREEQENILKRFQP
jgi:hypothetical protein